MKKLFGLLLLASLSFTSFAQEQESLAPLKKKDDLPSADEYLVITPAPPVKPDSERVYTIVDQVPEFKGGIKGLSEYLSSNINYPNAAKTQNLQGRVFIQFVIDEKGDVTNVGLCDRLKNTHIGGGCEEEAIRVVSSMPKWKPGKQKGKFVKVLYILPVTFSIKS